MFPAFKYLNEDDSLHSSGGRSEEAPRDRGYRDQGFVSGDSTQHIALELGWAEVCSQARDWLTLDKLFHQLDYQSNTGSDIKYSQKCNNDT